MSQIYIEISNTYRAAWVPSTSGLMPLGTTITIRRPPLRRQGARQPPTFFRNRFPVTPIVGAYGCIGYGIGLLGFDEVIALVHASAPFLSSGASFYPSSRGRINLCCDTNIYRAAWAPSTSLP